METPRRSIRKAFLAFGEESIVYGIGGPQGCTAGSRNNSKGGGGREIIISRDGILIVVNCLLRRSTKSRRGLLSL
jgi:hypothetical protein